MAFEKIHIIAFNIPCPADYGGVIDIFYKILNLHKSGIKIILHCFQYGRNESEELSKICDDVFYYKRKMGIRYFLNILPYIVITRKNKSLLNNLLRDEYPILFEGLHSCYYLSHKTLKNRQKIVRTHNIEHHYYRFLAGSEKNIVRKIFFLTESLKLRFFEKKLNYANSLVTISKTDYIHFRKYKKKNTLLIPAFHPFVLPEVRPGKGKYLLYHANLSVTENQKALHFLIQNVFSKLDTPVLIAGKNPPKWILDASSKYKHIAVVPNPSANKLEELILSAHIHVLYTFQPTGLKLKLLYVLFKGRFCIANSLMTENTGLESVCYTENTPGEIITRINQLMNQEFNIDSEEMSERRKILEKSFSNKNNTKCLVNLFRNEQFNFETC